MKNGCKYKLYFGTIIVLLIVISELKCVSSYQLKSLETALSIGSFNDTKAADILKILKINQQMYNSTSDEYMIQEEDVLKNSRKITLYKFKLYFH